MSVVCIHGAALLKERTRVHCLGPLRHTHDLAWQQEAQPLSTYSDYSRCECGGHVPTLERLL